MVCIFQRQLFLAQTSRGPKKAQMKITMQPLHSAHDQQWSTAVSLPQKSGRGKETSYRMIRHKNFLKLWPKPACAEHGDLLQFCCMHGWMFTINIQMTVTFLSSYLLNEQSIVCWVTDTNILRQEKHGLLLQDRVNWQY